MDSMIVKLILKRTQIQERSIKSTLELLEDGATIPFIARYRKEKTGGLEDVQIEKIKNEYQSIQELIKRKEYILNVIKEQGKLNAALERRIRESWTSTEIEDIYLPFKKKVKTKATMAKEKGLEPLARFIMKQEYDDLDSEVLHFINKKVSTVEEALEGARHIMAEWMNEHAKIREITRRVFNQTAFIKTKLVKKKEKDAGKFKDYFDFQESLKKAPSHRVLAMFRGADEGFLKLSLDVDGDTIHHHIERFYIKSDSDSSDQIKLAIQDAYKRLIFPSIENEYLKQAKEKADIEAIEVFAQNLKQLLLESPLGSKRIIAIDPGFRTGCKVVALDEYGDFLINDTIYPHPPQNDGSSALKLIRHWVAKYNIEAIAIGNGTAGKESYDLIKYDQELKHLEVFLVNESGASIYSASPIARAEFPDLDITVKGAISIGRRLMDPLAELVKIDAKSIGVGQYQHDVNQPKLKSSLDQVVENCVNAVGVNVNTASQHLLSYVSGLGPTLAKNLISYRSEHGEFEARNEIKKVPRMGKKAFEQAAGFLRIKDGHNPLDNSGVHPERYGLVKKMAKDLKVNIPNLLQNQALLSKIKLHDYVSDDVGLPTLEDIIKELKKPGLDPRGKAVTFQFTEGLNSIDDLSEGMFVKGVINNITKFGAFVDMGIKASGLIHISQLSNTFVSDINKVVKLNQKVEAKVIAIDKERKRISLSLKE